MTTTEDKQRGIWKKEITEVVVKRESECDIRYLMKQNDT